MSGQYVEMKNVGGSGLRTSLLGLDCNDFGTRLDVEATQHLVYRAIDLGVTLFDTADSYGTGASEEQLGEVLGDHR